MKLFYHVKRLINLINLFTEKGNDLCDLIYILSSYMSNNQFTQMING